MLLKTVIRVVLMSAVAVMAEAKSKATFAKVVSEVVPAVQQVKPGSGQINFVNPRLIVAKSNRKELGEMAKNFAEELASFGKKCVKSGGAPVSLALGKVKESDSPEAYCLDINNGVTITGNSVTGVFYGTRTLLQMIAQKHNSEKLPKGKIVDWPAYKVRSLMLDAGRCPFPLPVLYDYLRMMSWYKMNELHLHLNDVAGDYYAFRVECETYPELTAKDLFYTKKELREFQKVASELGIMVVPEFDVPGHATCFTKIWPELQYRGEKTWRGHHDHYLEIKNPEVLKRIKKLLDEMIPLFDGPDVHIGTDEYRIGGWPHDKDFLERNDLLIKFANDLNKYIRSKGKNTRMWYGTDHIKSKIKPDPTIILDIWNLHGTNQFKGIEESNRMINSNEWASYIVPGVNYYGVNNKKVYERWTPDLFGGGKEFKGADLKPENLKKNLLGAKLHVWMDAGPKKCTMQEIADLTLPSLQVYAEKLWGVKGSENYETFKERAAVKKPVPFMSVIESPLMPVGMWKPAMLSTGYKEITVDVSEYVADSGKYAVTLKYKRGGQGLDIAHVKLYSGSELVAADVHEGFTGSQSRQNQYILNVKKAVGGKLTLKLKVRGSGGTDSHGEIFVEKL